MTAGVGRGLLPEAQPPPLLNKPTQRFTLAGHFLHQQPLTALIRRIACDVITQLAPALAWPGRYPYLLARRYRPHGHNGEPGHLLPDDANRTEPEDMHWSAELWLPGTGRLSAEQEPLCGNTLILAGAATSSCHPGRRRSLAEAWQATAGHHLCQLAISGSGTAFAVSPVSKLRQLLTSVVPACLAGTDQAGRHALRLRHDCVA